jgi:hypothetical protein
MVDHKAIQDRLRWNELQRHLAEDFPRRRLTEAEVERIQAICRESLEILPRLNSSTAFLSVP